MAKYTDEQIKQGLDSADLFLRNRADAKPAPINEYDKEEMLDIAKICNEALDLINRQEAEIERLKDYNENLLTANTALSNEILDIKSEAIKEFAERVEAILCLQINPSRRLFWKIKADIDNLVKEMVGESK